MIGGTAAIMSDHTKAIIQKEHHLRIPVVRGQGPAMREHNGLPAAPILIEDVNAIFRAHLIHRMRSLILADWITATITTSLRLIVAVEICSRIFIVLLLRLEPPVPGRPAPVVTKCP
jgi:hypothetical protein